MSGQAFTIINPRSFVEFSCLAHDDYIIHKIILSCLLIKNFSSRVQLHTSLILCTHM